MENGDLSHFAMTAKMEIKLRNCDDIELPITIQNQS